MYEKAKSKFPWSSKRLGDRKAKALGKVWVGQILEKEEVEL